MEECLKKGERMSHSRALVYLGFASALAFGSFIYTQPVQAKPSTEISAAGLYIQYGGGSGYRYYPRYQYYQRDWDNQGYYYYNPYSYYNYPYTGSYYYYDDYAYPQYRAYKYGSYGDRQRAWKSHQGHHHRQHSHPHRR